MLLYPHRLSLKLHVSNESTYQEYAMESNGTHYVLLDYSGREEGKVEVLDKLAAIVSS